MKLPSVSVLVNFLFISNAFAWPNGVVFREFSRTLTFPKGPAVTMIHQMESHLDHRISWLGRKKGPLGKKLAGRLESLKQERTQWLLEMDRTYQGLLSHREVEERLNFLSQQLVRTLSQSPELDWKSRAKYALDQQKILDELYLVFYWRSFPKDLNHDRTVFRVFFGVFSLYVVLVLSGLGTTALTDLFYSLEFDDYLPWLGALGLAPIYYLIGRFSGRLKTVSKSWSHFTQDFLRQVRTRAEERGLLDRLETLLKGEPWQGCDWALAPWEKLVDSEA